MLYLTFTTITSVVLAHYGVSRSKDWVSVDCGTTHKGKHLYTYEQSLRIVYILEKVCLPKS